MKQITDRQRAFCQFLVQGERQIDAYRLAFGKTDAAQASKLTRKDNIRAYLEELREPDKTAFVLTRQKKREILADIATGKIESSSADRARAIQIDNLMTGDNQPVKIEGELTLHAILSEIKAEAGPLGDELE